MPANSIRRILGLQVSDVLAAMLVVILKKKNTSTTMFLYINMLVSLSGLFNENIGNHMFPKMAKN